MRTCIIGLSVPCVCAALITFVNSWGAPSRESQPQQLATEMLSVPECLLPSG